jgi:lipid-binding SYLF domain-containing protein
MTTIETQARRMLKVLGGAKPMGYVPPQLLEETKGMMFFKKIPYGKQSDSSTGIFFKRDPQSGEWSLPTTMHFSEGNVQLHNDDNFAAPSKAVDVIVLINDVDTVNAFETYGQFSFDEKHRRVVRGPVINSRDKDSGASQDVLDFVTQCSTDPFFIVHTSFAYMCIDRVWRGCAMENTVFQSRDSSNEKFYKTKSATTANLLNVAMVPNRSGMLVPVSSFMPDSRVTLTKCCRKLLNAWLKPNTKSLEEQANEPHGLAPPPLQANIVSTEKTSKRQESTNPEEVHGEEDFQVEVDNSEQPRRLSFAF